VHDDAKDKEFELELSWVCEESKGFHQFVPKDLADEAETLAKVNNNNNKKHQQKTERSNVINSLN
jgi:20S proteasome subunit alpha 7